MCAPLFLLIVGVPNRRDDRLYDLRYSNTTINVFSWFVINIQSSQPLNIERNIQLSRPTYFAEAIGALDFTLLEAAWQSSLSAPASDRFLWLPQAKA